MSECLQRDFYGFGRVNFGFTFGAAVGGSIDPVDGRAANIPALEGVMRELVQLTKPIMTTGVNGMKPVARFKGQEAVNGTYLNVVNKNLTRGTHVSMAEDYDGSGVREFHLDDQYKHTKRGGATKISQRLIVDFHTHPFSFTNSDRIPMYAWPSVQDIYSHVLQRIFQKVDRDAILTIGFMVKGKYYLQLIETHNDISLDTISSFVNKEEKFGNFLKLIFKSKTKIAIIGENGKEIDYMQFLKIAKIKLWLMAFD